MSSRFRQGSHGHEIPGKVLKFENKNSSPGKVLELIKGPGIYQRSWKNICLCMFLATDLVNKKTLMHPSLPLNS